MGLLITIKHFNSQLNNFNYKIFPLTMEHQYES